MAQQAKRSVTAPASTLRGAPAVQSVLLGEDEDVQWTWTYTPEGSYVSGYTIVKREPERRAKPSDQRP